MSGWMLIRLAIMMVYFIIVCVCIKKKTVYFIAALIGAAFIAFAPGFEDLFYSFDSLESAYSYVSGVDEEDIDAIIEGEESVLILSEKDESNRYTTFLIKDNGKYNIGNGPNNDKYLCGELYSDLDLSVSILTCHSTNDHYVLIEVKDDTERAVADSLESEFVRVDYAGRLNPNQKGNKASYCAYIANFDENYTVTIDGVDYVPYNFED